MVSNFEVHQYTSIIMHFVCIGFSIGIWNSLVVSSITLDVANIYICITYFIEITSNLHV